MSKAYFGAVLVDVVFDLSLNSPCEVDVGVCQICIELSKKFFEGKA